MEPVDHNVHALMGKAAAAADVGDAAAAEVVVGAAAAAAVVVGSAAAAKMTYAVAVKS